MTLVVRLTMLVAAIAAIVVGAALFVTVGRRNELGDDEYLRRMRLLSLGLVVLGPLNAVLAFLLNGFQDGT